MTVRRADQAEGVSDSVCVFQDQMEPDQSGGTESGGNTLLVSSATIRCSVNTMPRLFMTLPTQ